MFLGRLDDDRIPLKPKISRSPQWGRIRDEFIRESGSKCAACGKATNLEVHHIIPVAKDKTLELDKSNLIVLCENKSIFCHLILGHSFSWIAYNPHVIEDSAQLRERIKTRSVSSSAASTST